MKTDQRRHEVVVVHLQKRAVEVEASREREDEVDDSRGQCGARADPRSERGRRQGRDRRERYALLWLVTGIALTVLSAWRDGLNTIAGWLGIRSYPPAVLFAVGLLFVILVLLHYSTVISRLSDQNVILAQRLALLELEVSEGRASAGGEAPAAAEREVPAR